MYSTLLVNLELGRDNTSLLSAAGHLAERFDAEVVGVGACEPLKVVYSSGNLPGGIVEMDDAEIKQHADEAERQLRAMLEQRVRSVTWRASITDWPSQFAVRQARCADLVIVTQGLEGDALDRLRNVNISDLIMQAGRPVLIVPPSVAEVSAQHIFVGWKDTRESRRAVLDALPLLKRAAQVTVMEIAAPGMLEEARFNVGDVASWLRHHGVSARSQALPAAGKDPRQLRNLAQEAMADLIVIGAYGHSRFREWVLGGVTKDLMLHATVPVMLSH